MRNTYDKGNLYDRLNQAIQQTRELVVSMEVAKDDDAGIRRKRRLVN